MKNLSKQNAIDLINWFETTGQKNWGVWGNYPSLPVGASYLSYDTNPCQINLSETISINGEEYNCISNNRHTVGKKWNKTISFEDLKDWAIDGYLNAKKASQSDKYNSIVEKFDNSPSDLKELYRSMPLNLFSNNKRKSALNQKLREFGISGVSELDCAMQNTGRRKEFTNN